MISIVLASLAVEGVVFDRECRPLWSGTCLHQQVEEEFMRKHFVKGFVALAMAASFAGCMASDDTASVAESDSELGLDSTLFDSGTVCTAGGVQMHCCPNGFVMTGIHVNDNVLRCSRLQAGFTGPTTLDAGTVRNSMHACPIGQLMVGIHVGRNLL